MSERATWAMLMSASDHAAKQMKYCVIGGDRWRAWVRTSLQLAEEASRICDEDENVFSWERDR